MTSILPEGTDKQDLDIEPLHLLLAVLDTVGINGRVALEPETLARARTRALTIWEQGGVIRLRSDERPAGGL